MREEREFTIEELATLRGAVAYDLAELERQMERCELFRTLYYKEQRDALKQLQDKLKQMIINY